MKLSWWIVVLIISVMCTSMTQCPKCITGDFKIEVEAKKWLPYQSVDSVTFISSTGSLTKFRCFFGEATNQYVNSGCNDTFTSDSLGASIEIIPADSLLISCNLSSPNSLCFIARNRSTYFVSGCNVLSDQETVTRKIFTNLILNNFLYNDVRLVVSYPGNTPAFDSVYFAKNYGVISFVYNNVKYFLHH